MPADHFLILRKNVLATDLETLAIVWTDFSYLYGHKLPSIQIMLQVKLFWVLQVFQESMLASGPKFIAVVLQRLT